MRSSRELLQEPNIGIVEDSDVGDVVAQHRNPRGPHAEGPARITLVVDPCRLEDGWMDHARAQDLHPSRALAPGTSRAVTELALDIHLGRRLRERKKARTEARLRLAEQP